MKTDNGTAAGALPAFSNIDSRDPKKPKRYDTNTLVSHLLAVGGDWPKLIGGALTVRRHDGTLAIVKTPAELFGWLHSFTRVVWSKAGMTRGDFFSTLAYHKAIERYDGISDHPHFPWKLPGICYTRPRPKAKKTGALDKLLDKFTLATPQDREFLRLAILTEYWSGPTGARPMFVFVADDSGATVNAKKKGGRRTGKTKCAELVASLVGGVIKLPAAGDEDTINTRLLAPAAAKKRVNIIDNLKSYRWSNGGLESLTTADTINGHQMYEGFAERPNYLTTFVTVNGPAFSADMAYRSVFVTVARPTTKHARWLTSTKEFIADNRREIEQDVRHIFEQEPAPLVDVGDWGEWGAEVLARCADPEALLKLLASRGREADAELADATSVTEHVRAHLKEVLSDANLRTAVVAIPALVLGRWVAALKGHRDAEHTAQYLRGLRSPRLTKKATSKQRYYIWRGESADAGAEPTKTLVYHPNGTVTVQTTPGAGP